MSGLHCGADSGVAEKVSHQASVSKTSGEGVDERLFSDTVCGRGCGLLRPVTSKGVNKDRFWFEDQVEVTGSRQKRRGRSRCFYGG
jgi:hypothetical protein